MCLSLTGAAAAQDYRVTAEKGTAWGCLRLPEAKDMQEYFAEALEYDDYSMRFTMTIQAAEALDFYIKAELCAVFESDDVLTIVGEEEEDPEWVQIKTKDWWRTTREMWSRREWFETVPDR